jgi:hypothetical protein
MKPLLSLLLLIFALCQASAAAEPSAKAVSKRLRASTRTFFIEGVQSDAHARAIVAAASKVESVTSVVDLTPSSGFANISFDHGLVTHQQIAQAISAAGPFQVSFKFRVPAYAQEGNAAKIDAIFDRYAKLVSIEPLDPSQGLFAVHFLPFTPGPDQPGQGFNIGHIVHPLHDPAPKGLGLFFEQVTDGSLKFENEMRKKLGKPQIN